MCKVNLYHPDCQLTAVTVTEGKREYSVDGAAVTIDVAARRNSNTRMNLMLGPEASYSQTNTKYRGIDDLMQMMSEPAQSDG